MSFFISRMPLAGLRSSPPLSKQTPLPMIAMRGLSGLAPLELDQPRSALRPKRPARPRRSMDSLRRDPCRRSLGPRRRTARPACELPARARRDQGRLPACSTRSRTSAVASASRMVASIFAGSPVSSTRGPRSALVLLRAIGVEAMLGEQPAERGRTGLALRKLVCPFGQALTELGEAPGRKLRSHRPPPKRLRIHRLCAAGRRRRKPVFPSKRCAFIKARSSAGRVFAQSSKLVFVDEVDRMGFLAAVGDEQGREVGHWSDALASCSTG